MKVQSPKHCFIGFYRGEGNGLTSLFIAKPRYMYTYTYVDVYTFFFFYFSLLFFFLILTISVGWGNGNAMDSGSGFWWLESKSRWRYFERRTCSFNVCSNNWNSDVWALHSKKDPHSSSTRFSQNPLERSATL